MKAERKNNRRLQLQPAMLLQPQSAAPKPAANLPSRQKSNLPTCQAAKNEVFLSEIIWKGLPTLPATKKIFIRPNPAIFFQGLSKPYSHNL